MNHHNGGNSRNRCNEPEQLSHDDPRLSWWQKYPLRGQ
jgi:hypothetical protein